MNRKKLISILSLGALVVTAVLGVAAYRSASAAAPTRNVIAHVNFGRGFGGGDNNEDLANALGISVDELNTAYHEANNAALDQAVQAGLLTQVQADQLRANGFAFPFGGRWGSWLSQNGIEFDALLANALGITVDRLKEAYLQAHEARIDRSVADGRITQEQADLLKGKYALFSSESFRSAMQSAFEAAVRQAVANGVITQAQADQILKNGAGMGFFGFKGFGGFHGFHRPGPHGRWGSGGAPVNPLTPPAPPVTPSNGL